MEREGDSNYGSRRRSTFETAEKDGPKDHHLYDVTNSSAPALPRLGRQNTNSTFGAGSRRISENGVDVSSSSAATDRVGGNKISNLANLTNLRVRDFENAL